MFFGGNKIKNKINEKIKSRQVKVIDENGVQLEVMNRDEAIDLAKSRGLDLVLVSENAKPYPIAKFMDYGKVLFERAKKQKEARKHSKTMETKEIRLSANIAEHDIDFKAKNARKFLTNGNKVKVTLRFKGREIAKNEMGKVVLEKFADMLSDVSEVQKRPSMEGRQMFMILESAKGKGDKNGKE